MVGSGQLNICCAHPAYRKSGLDFKSNLNLGADESPLKCAIYGHLLFRRLVKSSTLPTYLLELPPAPGSLRRGTSKRRPFFHNGHFFSRAIQD